MMNKIQILLLSLFFVVGCHGLGNIDRVECDTEEFSSIVIQTTDTTNFGKVLGSWAWVKTESYGFNGNTSITSEETDSTMYYIFREDSTLKIYPDSCLTQEGTFSTGDISTQVDSLNDPYIPGVILELDGQEKKYHLSFLGLDSMIISQAAWDGPSIIFAKIQ